MMFSQHGHFTLAHSDRSLVVQNERAEVNKLLGIDSRVIDRDEVKKLCPQINIGEDVTWPILGALYHPPGGIIRHDAVVWGYAKQAGRRGVEIHQGVEVTGFDVKDGRIQGVRRTGRHLDERRPQRHRRLVDARRRAGRRAAPDHRLASCRRS